MMRIKKSDNINKPEMLSEFDNKHEIVITKSLDHQSSLEEYSKIEMPIISTQCIIKKYYTKELKGLTSISWLSLSI